MSGKELRLARLLNPTNKRCFMVPIDHGATVGPIDGLGDYLGLIKNINNGRADAIVMHKGLLKTVSQYPFLGKGKYILHLSASTSQSPDPNHKILVGSVEEALKLGADGVSVHVNLGVAEEAEMLRDLGLVSKACLEWGMPLLAMMYSHGRFKDIAHAARIAEELGADMVKVSYPGSIEALRKITGSLRIPVLIAGGTTLDHPGELFKMVEDALTAGAAGVAIGRNIFQYRNPHLITLLIGKLVHENIPVEECLHQLLF